MSKPSFDSVHVVQYTNPLPPDRTVYPANPPSDYVGPLDLTASASLVAFSQRALSAAKRGTALYTIRRDSDDHTQSFSSDATTGAPPLATISAFVGAAASLVALWKDQSGGGHDASNATLAQQPAWVANQIGDKPAIQNETNTQLFTSGNLAVPAAMTVFAVWKCPGAATATNLVIFAMTDGASNTYLSVLQRIAIDGSISQVTFGIEDEATANLAAAGFISDGSGGHLPLPSPVLFDFALAHGTDNAFGNGTALDSDPDLNSDVALGARTASPFILFNDFIPSPSYVGSGIAFAELIVFPSILADADRTAIRENIAAYYGITLS